jgi:HEAT repeat protein
MQWVEGLTLNAFVRQYADKPAIMKTLLQVWVRMAARLRGMGIAHGDLQHGNILLVPGPASSQLAFKLVDYDGMFVPALAGRNSGEVGHASYQHPQRVAERIYSADVDRFPLLLVAAALDGLRVGGRALWDEYDNGDNLLFREVDLRAPVKSPLFYELLKLPDERASRLARQTVDALKGRLDSVPLLEELFPELLPTVSKPETAPPPATRKFIPATAAESVHAAETRVSAWHAADEGRFQARQRIGRKTLVMFVAGVAMVVLALFGGITLAFRAMLAQPVSSAPIARNALDSMRQSTPNEPDKHKKSKDDTSTAQTKTETLKHDAPLAPSKPPDSQDPSYAARTIDAGEKSQTKPASVKDLPLDAPIADLRRALKSEDDTVREVAAARLANLGPGAEPALDDLAETLSDEKNTERTRRNAALALSNHGPAAKKAIPALIRALRRTQPLEVRRYAAEALAKMAYPANAEAIPAILEVIEKDHDPILRQKCVWALFELHEIKKKGIDTILVRLLDEDPAEMRLAQYDAARKLANELRDATPDKTVGVLLDMLGNKSIKVYKRTDLQPNLRVDARYMAADALGWLGEKARRRKDVTDALRAATMDADPQLRKSASAALKSLGVP